MGIPCFAGGQADWSDKCQTYLQLYTSDMVVTGDGRIYCTTTSEEGARAAGIYKDGDALEDIPGFGLDSGSSVAVEDALAPSGGKASFEAKDDAGFVGLEFEKLSAVHSVRFSGAGFTTFVGAKLQGSTAGPTGPWTDILKIEYEPRGWPETVIPLDGTAWRALRIAGSKMGVAGLGAFTRLPAVPGEVIVQPERRAARGHFRSHEPSRHRARSGARPVACV